MTDGPSQRSFKLEAFLPYMLNQVAEAVSKAFQDRYQKDFGITRTQWRILAHLFAQDGLTAKEIGTRIHEDKVSISRAVAALEGADRLVRRQSRNDRRFEDLHLTPIGRELFERLSQRALDFETELTSQLGADATARLRLLLTELLPLVTQKPPSS